jgi:hypothetical protein
MAKWYCLISRIRINALVGPDGKPSATDFDTLAFKLEVKCEKNNYAEKEENNPHRAFKHANGILCCFLLLTC